MRAVYTRGVFDRARWYLLGFRQEIPPQSMRRNIDMTSINAPARLAAFAGVIAAVFGGAVVVGGATGASPPNDKPAKAEHRTGEMAMKTGHAEMSAEPAGLAIAEGGFRVAVSDPTFRAAHRQELRFRVLDRAGRPVRNFEEE